MVTAGVYMVARCNVLFRLAPDAMLVVAVVGGFTALFAATIGLAQNDIKKVLAYSTVSQLGYMFLACGVGAFAAGMFHVMTHAFFKACLFLGSGLGHPRARGGAGHPPDGRPRRRRSRRPTGPSSSRRSRSRACRCLAGFFSKDAIKAAVFDAEFERRPVAAASVLWTRRRSSRRA